MCCAPSQSRCPKFRSNGVHGVCDGIPEYTREDGETRGSRNGYTMVDIQTDPIIHDLFVYISMGMYVSTKQKDNKTVMGHNKLNNQKWNITRSPEF